MSYLDVTDILGPDALPMGEMDGAEGHITSYVWTGHDDVSIGVVLVNGSVAEIIQVGLE